MQWFCATLGILFISSSFCLADDREDNTHKPLANKDFKKIIATAAGMPVYEYEVHEAVRRAAEELEGMSGQEREEKEKTMLKRELRKLIERELIIQEAIRQLRSRDREDLIAELDKVCRKAANERIVEIRKQIGASSEIELRNHLNSQGMTLEGLQRHLIRSGVLQIYVQDVLKPVAEAISEEMLKAYYDEHPDEFESKEWEVAEDGSIVFRFLPNGGTGVRPFETPSVQAEIRKRLEEKLADAIYRRSAKQLAARALMKQALTGGKPKLARDALLFAESRVEREELSVAPRLVVQEKIIATVRGKPIYDFEIRDGMCIHIGDLFAGSKVQLNAKEQQHYKGELKHIIDRELVIDELLSIAKKRRGVDLKPLFEHCDKQADQWMEVLRNQLGLSATSLKKLLISSGRTFEGVRRQWARDVLMRELLREYYKQRIEDFTSEQMKEYYDNHLVEFQMKERVVWQDLFIFKNQQPIAKKSDSGNSAKMPATQVVKSPANISMLPDEKFAADRDTLPQALPRVPADRDALILPASFVADQESSKQVEKVRKHCEDLAQRARKGADFAKLIDEFDSRQFHPATGAGEERGQIFPSEVEPTVFALKQGEIGIVEVEAGFHIIRVAERIYAGSRPFSDPEVEAKIQSKLKTMLYERERRELVKSLRLREFVEEYLATNKKR